MVNYIKNGTSYNKKWHKNLWHPFTQVNSSKPPLQVTNACDALIFREDGSYLVSRVEDKKFVGKNIVYAGLWKKNDRHMIYNVVYLNKDDNKTYIKRFSIESILKDKEYPISKKADSAKILYITGNPNSESEVVDIYLHHTSKSKRKNFKLCINRFVYFH